MSTSSFESDVVLWYRCQTVGQQNFVVLVAAVMEDGETALLQTNFFGCPIALRNLDMVEC
jgi:hypothetical protein